MRPVLQLLPRFDRGAPADGTTTPYDQLVGWQFGEFLLRSEFDNVTSTIKARQAGFTACLDTEDRFLELFERLVTDRVIPPVR